MSNDCIFCQLAQDSSKTHTVYEDESVLAFLDKHPINPGHILVIPKEHISNFYELDEQLYFKVLLTVKRLSKLVNAVTKPKKVGLLIAGFDVPHTHIHIVPMHDYHDLTSKSLLEGKRANPTDAELSKVAESLKARLN